MKSFIVASLLSLMTLFPNAHESTLNDVAKPYLGEYECKSAQLGSKDCLKKFSYIRLELKDEKNFTISYQEKGEKKKKIDGKYTYDQEKGMLKLTGKGGRFKREFPLNEGLLTVSLPIGKKNLILQFEQK